MLTTWPLGIGNTINKYTFYDLELLFFYAVEKTCFLGWSDRDQAGRSISGRGVGFRSDFFGSRAVEKIRGGENSSHSLGFRRITL